MKEQYTVRVYNSDLVKKIECLYAKCKNYYANKNSFMVDCLCRGMSNIERDTFGVKNIQDLNELYDEIAKTTQTLNSLIKLSERNSKENLANLMVNQRLLSCNYNMMLGLTEKRPIEIKAVEDGIFDELPVRFKITLNDILEQIKKMK